MVLANYRSAITNAFFIRNSPEGRELAMDWLAITQSGYVQCHGFDQVILFDYFFIYFMLTTHIINYFIYKFTNKSIKLINKLIK